MTIVDNPDPVLLQAITLKHALRLYAKTGLLPNRQTSATKLLQIATRVTGKSYKRGQHAKAAEDIEKILKAGTDPINHSQQLSEEHH